MIKKVPLFVFSALIVSAFFIANIPKRADAAEIRDIIFPVIGATGFQDDFGDPRSGGRAHEGNDIFAKKGSPLVAAVDGMVRFVAYPQPSYGYMVSITDEDGYRYNYLHLNNDTPGTDDGKGGGTNAYAPGMERGWPVVKGQLVGWLGDSGNAESTAPHLHFEIRTPDGEPINPYESLRASRRISAPVMPPARPDEIVPFGPFRGGSTVARGQIDPSTPEHELIVAAGPGGGPHIRIYRPDRSLLTQFFVQPTTMRSGLDVASGDMNGDGTDEVIVGFGKGQKPKVMVLNTSGELIQEFYAYVEAFAGGVQVASADLDADGVDEIITGPGRGGGPEVRVFSGDGTLRSAWFAYNKKFSGGVDVAAISATALQAGRVITAPGAGGGPDVRVHDQNGQVLAGFYAYDAGFTGGVRVSVSTHDDITAPYIMTVPASRGDADLRLYDLSGNLSASAIAFEEWWIGGYDVTEANGLVYVATNKSRRRASIQILEWRPTSQFQNEDEFSGQE